MTRSRPIVLLGALALIWGSSFMFIKVAVREVEPSTLILGRLGLAALTLAIVVPVLVGGRRVQMPVEQGITNTLSLKPFALLLSGCFSAENALNP